MQVDSRLQDAVTLVTDVINDKSSKYGPSDRANLPEHEAASKKDDGLAFTFDYSYFSSPF